MSNDTKCCCYTKIEYKTKRLLSSHTLQNSCYLSCTQTTHKHTTRMALGGAHLPPTKVFQTTHKHTTRMALGRAHLPPTKVFQTTHKHTTRMALGGAHLPPTKVFRRSVYKTILKPRLALVACRQWDFPRRTIPCSSAYTISEKAIWFWHPDYDPDRAQKLISSSMSRHLSTRDISSKSMHTFLSNLANRQTDRQRNTGKNMYLLLCRKL